MSKDLFDFNIGTTETKKPDSGIEEILKKARVYSARGMYDKALELYNQVLEEDLENEQAFIGILRVHTKDFTDITAKEADQDIHAIQSLFPNCKDPDFLAFMEKRKGHSAFEQLFKEATKEISKPKPAPASKPAAAPKPAVPINYGPIKKLYSPHFRGNMFPWLTDDELMKKLNEEYLAESFVSEEDKRLLLNLPSGECKDNKEYSIKLSNSECRMICSECLSVYFNYWEIYYGFYAYEAAISNMQIANMYSLPEWRTKEKQSWSDIYSKNYLKVKTKKQLFDFVYERAKRALSLTQDTCLKAQPNNKQYQDLYKEVKADFDALEKVKPTIK